MSLLKLNKELIITTLFFIVCLVGYIYFPANGNFQYRFVSIIFLVILPFLYNRYFLKRKNITKKINIGDWRNNLKWLGIGWLFPFLIMALIFINTDLLQHYFLPTAVKNNFSNFLLYELTGVFFTVVVYEFFFRGLVMEYYSLLFGQWSILIQFLFFAVMVALIGLPYWFYILYLVFMPFAGWINYKTNSHLYSFLGQWFFIVIIDAFFIAMLVK